MNTSIGEAVIFSKLNGYSKSGEAFNTSSIIFIDTSEYIDYFEVFKSKSFISKVLDTGHFKGLGKMLDNYIEARLRSKLNMSLSMSDNIKNNGYHYPDLYSNENNDFVITGVSGRFPEANSIDEFAYNLFNGIDMVTADDRRWPQGQYGLPTRNGKLKEID
ncbi:unnamed protein product, partial [Rotaria sordida]